MVEFVLNAEPRDVKGKGASRRLRRAHKVPAIMYGAGKEPTMITLDQAELTRKLEHEAFYSHILTIKVGNTEERAVLKDMHRHPYKPIIQHLDLLRVSETEELRMHVPLHFINEDIAPGVKTEGGIVSHQMIEVEISCLPKDLPEYIEVDVGNLHVGEAIHLSELKVPEGVELIELSHGAEHDQSVVSIHMPRVAVEEEAKPAEEAAPAEGAAPAKPEGES